jgi:small neutral amino acid transporter SnatA (MarC family)
VTDFLRIALIFLLAVNPALVANALRDRAVPFGQAGLGAAAAIAVYLLLALGAGTILDGLAIEDETAQVAAGALLAVGGALAVATAGREFRDLWSEQWTGLFPLALPLVVSPAGVVAAISFSANDGIGEALGAAVIAVAVAAAAGALTLGRFWVAADALARISGAVLVLLAAGLIVDGVKSV